MYTNRPNKTSISVEWVLKRIENEKRVRLNNAVIEGDIDINKLNLPTEHVERTNWQREYIGLNEDLKVIKSVIAITNSHINGHVNLSNSILCKNFYFHNSEFCWDADFSGSIFKGAAILSKSVFSGESIFTGSTFVNDVFFAGSELTRTANFLGSTFGGDAYFRRCTLGASSLFNVSTFNGYAIFDKCTLSYDAHFNGSIFGGDTVFSKAVFNGDVTFLGCKFTGDILTFRGAGFNSTKSQEDACRRAKNVLEKNGDRRESEYHFFREMDAKRKAKAWYIRYPELVLIQWIFGYGVYPVRIAISWLVFVGVFAFLFSHYHGIDEIASQMNTTANAMDCTWFSIATAITPGYAGYKPTPDFKLVAGFEAIIGAFMWAAFIATFTRKYMK